MALIHRWPWREGQCCQAHHGSCAGSMVMPCFQCERRFCRTVECQACGQCGRPLCFACTDNHQCGVEDWRDLWRHRELQCRTCGWLVELGYVNSCEYCGRPPCLRPNCRSDLRTCGGGCFKHACGHCARWVRVWQLEYQSATVLVRAASVALAVNERALYVPTPARNELIERYSRHRWRFRTLWKCYQCEAAW